MLKKIKNMKKILILILIVPFFSFGQEFEFKYINTDQLRKEIHLSDKEVDPIYIYLKNNYQSTSEKKNVQMYDYPDYSICSFQQEFNHLIKYSVKSCQEAGGITTIIEIPKNIKKSKLINWIEKIYDLNLTDVTNSWNSNKTVYGPGDGEAGCYYEIKESQNTYLIENYCGC